MICLTNHFFILILCIHIEKRLQNVQLSKIKSKIISQHSNIQLCNTINLRCKSSSIISSIGLAIHHSYIVTTRKQSLGQGNIFRSVCQEFCSQGGFCLSTCWDTPLGPGTPQDQALPRSRPPWHSACWEIRSTSRWYASYWNAILFAMVHSNFSRCYNTEYNRQIIC